MRAVAKKTTAIEALASQINTAHRQAFGSAKKAMEYAAECGRLLIKAKELIPHGEWGRWLDQNTEVGWRQSQKYMRLANNWEAIQAKCDSDSHLNIEAALKLLREPPEEMGKYLERTGQRIESMTSPCGTPEWHRNEDGVMVNSQTLEPLETEDETEEEGNPRLEDYRESYLEAVEGLSPFEMAEELVLIQEAMKEIIQKRKQASQVEIEKGVPLPKPH